MRIGVIACRTVRHEVARLIEGDPDISEAVYLEAALHVHPERLRAAVVEQIESLEGRVDAVFLGYGHCGSLKGVEQLVGVPTVLIPHGDCITFLLTPERFAAEIEKEAGTWFMSPGWAEVGADMIVRELELDSAATRGREPMDLARRLFKHYRRGLFFNAGMGEEELAPYRERAQRFCSDFSLDFQEIEVADSPILREALERCKRLAAQAAG